MRRSNVSELERATHLPIAGDEPELAPSESLAPVAPVYPAVNGYTVSQLVQLAKLISQAVTLPDALRGKPDDILAVMLAGRELGIGPMQATRAIHIIKGSTALSTELKLALARRAGHVILPVRRSARMVRVFCSTCESHHIEWAVAPADASGDDAVLVEEIVDLREKRGTWQSYPFAMLWARAVGQLCREHCPEAVGGLYSVEELS
jgi:hypothetical protein